MAEKTEFCRKCGGQFPSRGLSVRGVCGQCRMEAFLDTVKQLRTKRGPVYRKWATHYIASMEATILKLRKELQEND